MTPTKRDLLLYGCTARMRNMHRTKAKRNRTIAPYFARSVGGRGGGRQGKEREGEYAPREKLGGGVGEGRTCRVLGPAPMLFVYFCKVNEGQARVLRA